MPQYYAKFVLCNHSLNNNHQMLTLKRFLLLWLSTTLALWVVDGLFESLRFADLESLALSGLLLALANLTLKPLLLLITLPLTLMSLGLALPVINGLVLLGVARLVPGFEIAGFWMGVLCALAVSVVGLLIDVATGQSRMAGQIRVVRRGGGRPDGGPGPWDSQAQDPNVIDAEVREKGEEKPKSGGKLDQDR